jgi:hypothetical protein
MFSKKDLSKFGDLTVLLSAHLDKDSLSNGQLGCFHFPILLSILRLLKHHLAKQKIFFQSQDFIRQKYMCWCTPVLRIRKIFIHFRIQIFFLIRILDLTFCTVKCNVWIRICSFICIWIWIQQKVRILWDSDLQKWCTQLIISKVCVRI